MLWFCYVLMLALIILTKVWNHKIKTNLSWGKVWRDFFFGQETNNVTQYYTWTILAAELFIGAWFIGDIPGLAPMGPPRHWTVALFLGSIAELIAPFFIKKAVDGIVAAASSIFNK